MGPRASLQWAAKREREQEKQYERLMERIAKIKDKKRQQELEDENDELISRVKRLKPVVN